MKRAFVAALFLSAAVFALWKAAPALTKIEQERGGENLALLTQAAGPDPMISRMRRADLRLS